MIIGAGQAGVETAISLRGKGHTASIVIVGDEPCLPYRRPPLSKEYLYAGGDRESVTLRPATWFDRHKIELRCGDPAMAIDRARCEVELRSGERIAFEHLVLATGARNRPLPVPGAQAGGVRCLRSLDEADRLRQALPGCRSVVIVGGGFIGLEVAAAARKLGAGVTVVEALARPMARAVSQATSAFFVAEHEGNGVRLRMNTGVTRIVEKEGQATGVEITGGEVLPADLVVVGIGVIPNTELAAEAGLEVDNGVVVDEYLQTSDLRISAIGDCAAFPRPDSPGRVRLESVQNAVDQGRCVAERIAGHRAAYHCVPWFWTEQYGTKLQMAGLTADCDVTVLRGSPEDRSFSVFCFADDRLVGVESVNQPREHMAARRLLATAVALTPEQAMDSGVDLQVLCRP